MPTRTLHVGVLSQPSNFHCEKWSRALARAGARVTVFTLDREGLTTADATDGVDVVHLPARVRWGGRYRYPSFYLSKGLLRKALADKGIDVVHPLHLTPFGTWALQAGHTPVVAAAMGADVLEYPPDRAHLTNEVRTWRQVEPTRNALLRVAEQLRNGFFRAQVQRVVARSALITADNQPLVDALLAWFGAHPAKTRLLRWGLEPELFDLSEAHRLAVRQHWGIPNGARVVLAPRGANALYQADVLVEAFARLLASGRFGGYYFLVLGAGYPAAPSVVRLAAQLADQYPGQFRFVPGQLPRKEVYALWSAVDVFLSTPVYDGYSAAIAEGRFVGAIPVVNAIPGNLEVIEDGYNGVVIAQPFGVETTVQALERVHARFEAYLADFAPRNRAWILEHSVLHRNAERWLEWAGALV